MGDADTVLEASRFMIPRPNVQRFIGHFGVSPSVCQSIWDQICFISDLGYSLQHLLMTLFYLKVNPTHRVAASACNVHEDTYRKIVHEMIEYLYINLPEVMKLIFRGLYLYSFRGILDGIMPWMV